MKRFAIIMVALSAASACASAPVKPNCPSGTFPQEFTGGGSDKVSGNASYDHKTATPTVDVRYTGEAQTHWSCGRICPENYSTEYFSKPDGTIWIRCTPAGSENRPRTASDSPFVRFLSEHKEDMIREVDVHGHVKFNEVYWQKTVWLGGLQYGQALGMHAPDKMGFAEFMIPAGARHFQAIFGLARNDLKPVYGRAAGRIYIDNILMWEKTVSGSEPVRTPPIAIPSGAQKLKLEVDGLGNKWAAHTTWADPHFVGVESKRADP